MNKCPTLYLTVCTR